MNVEHLVQMANQIATFFESQSETDGAVAETSSHLRKFWEPRMRREIIAYVQQGTDTALRPVARNAVLRLAQESAVGPVA